MDWWVNGGKKHLQLLLGLGGILHTWCHLGDGSRKDGQVTQAFGYFQLLIINAEEKKKIFCPCILNGGGPWGAKLSISRDPHKGPMPRRWV